MSHSFIITPMRRVNIEVRMEELIRCATRVFCEKGYQQTQMADIARAMGLSAGTLYLYVEGKESLFDLVVRHGVEGVEKQIPSDFPIPNPKPEETLAYLQKVLTERGQWPNLKTALKARRAKDPRSELQDILQELYSLMLRNRWGLILLARSALEFPGLAELFIKGLRKQLIEDLTQYISTRAKAKQFLLTGDANISAVFINETIAWAALHRMCDPEFSSIPDEQMNTTVVKALVNSFAPSKFD
jgi:AcrR family transcriptional regulator